MEKFPFAQDFQLKALVVLASDRSLLATKGHLLKPEMFENLYQGKLFGFIMTYFRKYKDLPSKDILVELAKAVARNDRELRILKMTIDAVYTAQISDGQKKFVKDSIIEFITHQMYKMKIAESVDLLKKKKYSAINDAIRQAAQAAVAEESLGTNYFKDVDKRMFDLVHEGDIRVPTMIHKLDGILRGGLGPGELGIILGASGIGKSIVLTNIEFAAMVNGKIVFDYSFEMSEREKGRRMDSRITGIPAEEIPEEADTLDRRLGWIKKLRGQYFVKQFPTDGATVHDIRAHIDLMEQVYEIKPDVIGVDYGMIIKPTKSFEQRRFEIMAVHKELRGLAVELQIPVWSPAQTSKKALDKEVVTKGDIGECWGIIEIADVVIALCQTRDEEKEDKMRIFIAKNRIHESSGIIPTELQKSRMLLRDLSNVGEEDDDDDEEEEEEEDEE